MGTQLTYPKRGTAPRLSAHVSCGQTAGWIKMPLGRELGLNPGDIVLDGDPLPPPERGTAASHAHFSTHVYCGYTWYGGRPRPRRHRVRWGPSSQWKGAQQTPSFRPTSISAKRSLISATTELVSLYRACHIHRLRLFNTFSLLFRIFTLSYYIMAALRSNGQALCFLL